MERRSALVVLQPTTYCNIDCSYCYLTRRNERKVMSGRVLQAVENKIIAKLADPASSVVVWHGGEPTAAGLGWFENAYRIFGKSRDKGLRFALQTNGLMLDDAWLDLLRDTNTSIGLSIDGPRHIHDARRRTRSGGGTWELSVRGLRRAQARGFRPNVISVLTSAAMAEPAIVLAASAAAKVESFILHPQCRKLFANTSDAPPGLAERKMSAPVEDLHLGKLGRPRLLGNDGFRIPAGNAPPFEELLPVRHKKSVVIATYTLDF